MTCVDVSYMWLQIDYIVLFNILLLSSKSVFYE